MNDLTKNIHRLLLDQHKTVSTAESITAGFVQHMLASVSGASDIFKGGITAYKRSVKVNQLGVDNELAKKYDSVHEDIVIQMAIGSLSLFESDYAIATCGYAEIDMGNPYAFIAIAETPDTILFSGRVELSGNRIQAQKQTARIALEQFESVLCRQ